MSHKKTIIEPEQFAQLVDAIAARDRVITDCENAAFRANAAVREIMLRVGLEPNHHYTLHAEDFSATPKEPTCD